MPEKDPSNYSILTYSLVVLLSMWGGTVNFIRKKKLGIVRAFNIVEFIGELVTSAFTGIIVFFLCEASDISPLMTAALVGIAGHMGSRLLYQLEIAVQNKWFPEAVNTRKE